MEDFCPWEQQCLIKKGKHENYNSELYLPAFDIITDNDGHKQERIIKRIFMPIKEAALELLSECLEPKINLEESIAYLTLCQKEELKPELEAYYLRLNYLVLFLNIKPYSIINTDEPNGI